MVTTAVKAIAFSTLLLLSEAIFGQSSQITFTTLRQATVLSAGDKVTGPVASSQPMHIVVALRLNNKAQLRLFLADTGHAQLTPAQFTSQYSPTVTQAQAVANYLTESGFQNVTISPNRLLVSGDGIADVTEAAFQTTLVSVYTHDGRFAYADSSAVHIPTSLQSNVLAVLGLQNVHIFHTFIVSAQDSNASPDTGGGGSEVGHNPTDFPVIYGASSLPAASSIAVGIVSVCEMTTTINDLSEFTSFEGLPAVATRVLNTQSCQQENQKDQAEWDLDSQDIIGMDGAVASLTFSDAASFGFADLTTAYNNAVTDDVAQIINVSLGACELDAWYNGAVSADDQIFLEADAQDQTFSASAGDIGANDCPERTVAPAYPASSPYVVSVGGTELYTSGTTTWATETVWNDIYGATGGTPSTFESQPSWQNGVGQNAGHSTRGVADIALDASPNSGAILWVAGNRNPNVFYGGTSLSSPLFVGMWARIRQSGGSPTGTLLTEPDAFNAEYLGCLGKPEDKYLLSWQNELDGFAAPMIYQISSANYSATFHDITSGNNNGESAAVGWDYPTGFGSMIANQIVNTVAKPVYVAQEQEDNDGFWVQFYSGGRPLTEVSVQPGHNWQFRVQAQNSNLTSPWAYIEVSAPSCGGGGGN